MTTCLTPCLLQLSSSLILFLLSPAEADEEIRRLIDKDFGKYKIEQEMLDLILEISTFRDFVTIYSIQNPEPLDFYILSSLMKSSANANVLAATKMRQMRLAITWGHAKIAREFIFSQKLYKFSVSIYRNNGFGR